MTTTLGFTKPSRRAALLAVDHLLQRAYGKKEVSAIETYNKAWKHITGQNYPEYNSER